MADSRNLPNADRLSVLAAAILLAYALTRFVDIPLSRLEVQLPGVYLAVEINIRTVVTRFGIVLGQGGGLLEKLVPLFKNFLGGSVGSGQQWLSWIHQQDQVRAFLFLLEQPELAGPVNFTAPNPARNRDFAKALGRALNRPAILPAPAFMLHLALGEFADVILTGQKVLPQKLLAAGFQFQFSTIDQALQDILAEG
ncbi:MAG: DUF1731 domain-containing protein [Syntrophobacterales bacterium]